MFVCNTTRNVDTARDPFDGLENMSPWTLMATKRWRNHHTSHMFMELFKYISGVNKVTFTINIIVIHFQIIRTKNQWRWLLRWQLATMSPKKILLETLKIRQCASIFLPSTKRTTNTQKRRMLLSSTPEDVVMILQQLQNLWILVLSTYRQDRPCMSLSGLYNVLLEKIF